MAAEKTIKKEPGFVYSKDLLRYKFSETHPFNPIRVQMTYELLRQVDAIDSKHIVQPRIATDEELLRAHSKEYISFVRSLDDKAFDEEQLASYGLSDDDTPVFHKMHEASALIAGATITAAEEVMSGKRNHALNLSGGLHHAMYGKASGFCVYNDIAVAIHYILDHYEAKVLYVDTDAHHGDGVQWAFYDDPRVCVLSIHETGRYLFPGTGAITERGSGNGLNLTVNIPVDAFTEDSSWYQGYEKALSAVVESFRPDIIISQNGADGHYYDPLTHLYLTMDTYYKIPQLAHKLAHEYCEGKWVALGGGGYDIFRVVPRAWSLIWLTMVEHPKKLKYIPKEWIDKWQKYSNNEIPKMWFDPKDLYEPIPREEEITFKNESTLKNALYILQGQQIGNRFRNLS